MQGTTDTIFAVATGATRAAISIVRISGPQAHDVVRAFAGRLPQARLATLARLRDPESGNTLDHALVLVWDAARSEVGEDGGEFHLHGSPAVVRAVLDALARQPDLRPAEPGEFARRAFRNGRMDLAQLEALADLIDAETEWQRRQAQRHLSGALRDATAPWRAALVDAAALVETAIDFAEDVEIADTLLSKVNELIDPVRDALRRELALAPAAERVRDGVQVVIAGPPNAGKSTLLNALARREAAIVSAVAGTTRDPIEVHLDLVGCPLTLVDTAGLRDTSEPVEQIGVRRARERAEAADLVLWVTDDRTPPPVFVAPTWRIMTKVDLCSRPPEQDGGPQNEMRPVGAPNQPIEVDGVVVRLSAQTGQNVDTLIDRLAVFAQDLAQAGSGLLARARHRRAFEAALAALEAASAGGQPVELLAEELRTGRQALERLIGSIDVEDVLGSIFSRFCIGK